MLSPSYHFQNGACLDPGVSKGLCGAGPEADASGPAPRGLRPFNNAQETLRIQATIKSAHYKVILV